VVGGGGVGGGDVHREEKMHSKWENFKRVKCFADLDVNGRKNKPQLKKTWNELD
jgi:hypothetical protein